jgi:hypothetical protein
MPERARRRGDSSKPTSTNHDVDDTPTNATSHSSSEPHPTSPVAFQQPIGQDIVCDNATTSIAHGISNAEAIAASNTPHNNSPIARVSNSNHSNAASNNNSNSGNSTTAPNQGSDLSESLGDFLTFVAEASGYDTRTAGQPPPTTLTNASVSVPANPNNKLQMSNTLMQQQLQPPQTVSDVMTLANSSNQFDVTSAQTQAQLYNTLLSRSSDAHTTADATPPMAQHAIGSIGHPSSYEIVHSFDSASIGAGRARTGYGTAYGLSTIDIDRVANGMQSSDSNHMSMSALTNTDESQEGQSARLFESDDETYQQFLIACAKDDFNVFTDLDDPDDDPDWFATIEHGIEEIEEATRELLLSSAAITRNDDSDGMQIAEVRIGFNDEQLVELKRQLDVHYNLLIQSVLIAKCSTTNALKLVAPALGMLGCLSYGATHELVPDDTIGAPLDINDPSSIPSIDAAIANSSNNPNNNGSTTTTTFLTTTTASTANQDRATTTTTTTTTTTNQSKVATFLHQTDAALLPVRTQTGSIVHYPLLMGLAAQPQLLVPSFSISSDPKQFDAYLAHLERLPQPRSTIGQAIARVAFGARTAYHWALTPGLLEPNVAQDIAQQIARDRGSKPFGHELIRRRSARVSSRFLPPEDALFVHYLKRFGHKSTALDMIATRFLPHRTATQLDQRYRNSNAQSRSANIQQYRQCYQGKLSADEQKLLDRVFNETPGKWEFLAYHYLTDRAPALLQKLYKPRFSLALRRPTGAVRSGPALGTRACTSATLSGWDTAAPAIGDFETYHLSSDSDDYMSEAELTDSESSDSDEDDIEEIELNDSQPDIALSPLSSPPPSLSLPPMLTTGDAAALHYNADDDTDADDETDTDIDEQELHTDDEIELDELQDSDDESGDESANAIASSSMQHLRHHRTPPVFDTAATYLSHTLEPAAKRSRRR